MISELIREKIIRMLGDELPHDTFVQVELLETKKKLLKSMQQYLLLGTVKSKLLLKRWKYIKENWKTGQN